MGNVINYFAEVKLELAKVIWPKREETVKLTITILVLTGIVAAYIGIIDFSLTKLLSTILS